MKRMLPSLVILAVTLTCGCATPVAPGLGTSRPRVLVGPFTIESQPLPGGLDRSEPVVLPTLLANEAAASAKRALVLGHHAAAIGQAPSQTAITGEAVVIGTIRLPTSMPPGLRGLRADAQKGTLATATLKLMAADGKILKETEATLSWRDARWLTGPPKSRRVRPVEAVLVEAVRKVVERAMERLEKEKENA